MLCISLLQFLFKILDLTLHVHSFLFIKTGFKRLVFKTDSSRFSKLVKFHRLVSIIDSLFWKSSFKISKSDLFELNLSIKCNLFSSKIINHSFQLCLFCFKKCYSSMKLFSRLIQSALKTFNMFSLLIHRLRCVYSLISFSDQLLYLIGQMSNVLL